MLVICFFNRTEEQITSLCQSSEEDKSLRAQKGSNLCTGLSDSCTGLSEHFPCQCISSHGCLINHIRCNFFPWNISQLSCHGRCFEHGQGSTDHACSRAVGFQTALSATAAWSSVRIHHHVSQLTGKTIATINQLPVSHDTRSYACSESEFYEVFHANRSTIFHFSHSSCICIIGNSNRNAQFL